ncbi:hypothetical protein C9374_007333 [Naegleria lovaniensis]|uniref:Uncharacterized protein n=1 Tax=Naegleria lovaniensis TaxID=51637 RepID=A0AA88GGW5_NAELO|nr:uncharacterized protein C9374_007333 [Naegleria lovaniensis]KAG2379194.1 hypothetical protein C9374_007333 [Naegleria lovaniensis]
MATGSTQTVSTKTPFGELIQKTLQERERNIVCLALEEKVSLMDIMDNEKTKGKRLLMEVDSIQELEKRKLLKRGLDPSPEVVDIKTTAMEMSIVSELPFVKDPFLGALEGQANECYTSSVDMLKNKFEQLEKQCNETAKQHKEEMNRVEQELENVKAQHKEEMNMLVHKVNERSMHQQEIEKIKKRISSLEGWFGCCFLRGEEVKVFEEHGDVISALLNNDDDKAHMLVSTKEAAIKLSQVFNLAVPVDMCAHAFKSKIFELLKQRLEPLRKFLFKEKLF